MITPYSNAVLASFAFILKLPYSLLLSFFSACYYSIGILFVNWKQPDLQLYKTSEAVFPDHSDAPQRSQVSSVPDFASIWHKPLDHKMSSSSCHHDCPNHNTTLSHLTLQAAKAIKYAKTVRTTIHQIPQADQFVCLWVNPACANTLSSSSKHPWISVTTIVFISSSTAASRSSFFIR